MTGRLFLIFGHDLEEFFVLFDLHTLCGIFEILFDKTVAGGVDGYGLPLMAKVLSNEFIIGAVKI